MRDGGSKPAERIRYGFELATSHQASERELEILMGSFAYYRDGFQSDPASAARYLAQGEAPRDVRLNVQELATVGSAFFAPPLAAYTAVASVILNLDATLTKD